MRIPAVIDPITRIEGHLRVEIEFDRVNGVMQVVEARLAGTLFRGFEKILVGRDPRDAQHLSERVCGICPVAHGMAAVLALDAACGVAVPTNARVMRNLVDAANFIDSHIMHFYLLTIQDYMDGPGKAPWNPTWRVDKRMTQAQSARFLDHFIKGIAMRRKAHEMGALYGGRLPHPNAFIPGGFTTTPREERRVAFRQYLAELLPFIREVYIPDTEELASVYDDYFAIGRGHGNLLAFGGYDQDNSGTNPLIRRGRIVAGSTAVLPVEESKIRESISHAWYNNSTNDLNPGVGDTIPENPKAGAYSWVKAPRYDGVPYEVGPLARMTVNGDYSNGVSVMDRIRARAAETLILAEAAQGWVEELDPAGPVYNQPTIPQSAVASGLTEAPRGALGHWLTITDGKIGRYQIITPTTWNAGPRDTLGQPGPLEQALLATPVENPDEPIEVLRVLHSIDPCLDCAVHVVRPRNSFSFVLPHTHGEEVHGGPADHAHPHPHPHDPAPTPPASQASASRRIPSAVRVLARPTDGRKS